MIKVIVALVFIIYVLLTAYSVNDIVVDIPLLPARPDATLSLGMLLPLFFALGLLAAILIGLGEWLRMRADNGRLARKNKELAEEITSLRNVAVMERDAE